MGNSEAPVVRVRRLLVVLSADGAAMAAIGAKVDLALPAARSVDSAVSVALEARAV